jgi:hypothetical protein
MAVDGPKVIWPRDDVLIAVALEVTRTAINPVGVKFLDNSKQPVPSRH